MPTPTPDGRELRAIASPLEIRRGATDDGTRTATGYAVLYGSVTEICGLWQERFARGAFTRSLRTADVMALHSHDVGRVVGRTGAGTLTLREDASGVAFENPLPDTTDGRDLTVSIDRGDIPGMSFGFRSTIEEWDETVSPPMRTIIEAELVEITYSACPQYDDTSVGLRSLDEARKERRGKNFSAAARRVAMKMTVDLRARGVTSKA